MDQSNVSATGIKQRICMHAYGEKVVTAVWRVPLSVPWAWCAVRYWVAPRNIGFSYSDVLGVPSVYSRHNELCGAVRTQSFGHIEF